MKEILIGIVQGLTEFLPVSSSGHIAVLEHYLGIFSGDLSREVALHLATLLAVLIYFRRKIYHLIVDWAGGRNLSYLWYLILGSIPAGVVGLLFESRIEDAFSSLSAIAVCFIFTGLVLLSTLVVKSGGEKITGIRSLIVGIAQALAIFPGVSRSGSTISAGLHLKLTGEEAFEFSFLLSIPAIAGAGLLEIKKVGFSALISHWPGIISSFIFGYIALLFLNKIVKKGKLYVFSPYLLALGLLLLIAGG